MRRRISNENIAVDRHGHRSIIKFIYSSMRMADSVHLSLSTVDLGSRATLGLLHAHEYNDAIDAS
jgi:hypothetical protein